MITQLTKKQEQRMQEVIQHWLSVGRSTQPIDREQATASITAMYRAIGKDAPAVLFFSSPMMCILAWGALRSAGVNRGQLGGQLRGQLGGQLRGQLGGQLWGQLGDQLGDQLRDQLRGQLWGQLRGQLWGQLGDQLGDQLRGQLRGQLWGQLRGQLGGQLWGQLGGQLRGQLRDQLWGQLRDQLGGQLWGQLGDQLNNYCGGSHWCAWEVFYDFCNEIGVNYTKDQRERLYLWMTQSQHCHWWFPYDGIVLVSERPTTLSVDDRGRLHSTETQAIGYSDGWGIHAVHGVRVDADIIENKASITVERIAKEQNAEVRRVMIELYGAPKYLLDSGAKIINHDQAGILYRKDILDDEAMVMVRVLNSTPEPDGVMMREEAIAVFGDAAKAAINAPEDARFKEYMIRVPPGMRTAHEAVAWTFGLDAEEYHPAIES